MLYPEGLLAAVRGARAKQNRWSDSCSSAPQNKTPVFTVFTVFAVSAARSGTANLSGYSEFLCKKITAGQGCSQIYRRVMLSNLMTAGVCCLRWRDACMRIMRIMRIMRRVLGASCYTPRVCLPLCGGARAKQNRRSDSCSSAPQIKPQYSQYSQYSQSAPPAEYSKPQRLFRQKRPVPLFTEQAFASEQKVLITRTVQPWRRQHV